jgi:hypothetical protein
VTRPRPARSAPAIRLWLVRYTGLAGAVLLAVAGRLGGVFPSWTAAVTPASIWRGEHGPLIIIFWLLGTGLLLSAWWAAARPGRPRSAVSGPTGTAVVGPGRAGDPVPSLRWAYVTAALWLLPLLVTVPMGSRDVYSYACQGWVYADGQDPYAAGVAQAGCPWLDSVSPIWRDTPAPYGPLFVVLAGLAVALGGTLVGTIGILRLLAVLGVLTVAVCLPGLARRAGLSDRYATWLVLGCPLVGVHLVAGAHNDAAMVGLLLAGLLMLVRGPVRPGPLLTGGVLLGLAVAVKVTALVVLPFAVLAALADIGGGRADYRTRTVIRTGIWVTGGALAALLGTSLGSGLGPGWVGGLASSGDTRQWTSPPTAVGFTVDYLGRLVGFEFDAVPAARLLAVLVLAVLLPLLWIRTLARLRRSAVPDDAAGVGAADGAGGVGAARERTRVALLGAGLALTATVLLAPVFHPWYAVWPLAVLAAAMVADRRWLLVPVSVASVLTLPDGTNLARFTKAPGAIMMTGLMVVLVVRGVRRRRLP